MLGRGVDVRYQVVFEGQATPTPEDGPILSPEGLEADLDRIMEELLKLEAEDATVSATLATGQVEIAVAVEADSFETALEKGNGLIRSAIHAAGGFTPDWSIDWLSVKTTKTEAPDDATPLVTA